MRRSQGLTESPIFVASGAVKAVGGYITNCVIAWTGRTAGDACQIRNGGATGEPLIKIAVATAAGHTQLDFPDGKFFPDGIYWDELGGGFTFSCTYK